MDRAGATPMIELLRTELRERFPELSAGAGPGVLQIGGTNWRGGRVHFAVLDADGRPALFARTTRNPADEPRLAREHELLSQMAASKAFRARVCAPVSLSRVGSRLVLCERAAPGRPMRAGEVPWSGKRFAANLAVARDVAIDLGRASLHEITVEELEAVVLEPLTRFWAEAGGLEPALTPMLGRLRRALGECPRAVVTHGDFIPKNLLLEGHACVVVDWETADPRGLPLLDLIYFLTRSAYVGAILPAQRKAAGVRAFYASDGRRALAARSALEMYCETLGVPLTLIDPVFRLHFLYKAMLKARTTSLHNPVTQTWLELFRERLDERAAPWPSLPRPDSVPR